MLESCASDPPTSVFADEEYVFRCIPAPEAETESFETSLFECDVELWWIAHILYARLCPWQIWKTICSFDDGTVHA